jgi:type IV pilus assembly protein PilC
MATFAYKVVLGGREFSGKRQAESEAVLRQELANEGYTIVGVRQTIDLFGPAHVSTESLILFTRQLRNLLKSGLSVVKAMDILFDQIEDPTLKESILDMLRAVETGSSLPDAFERHPEVFDRLYLASIRAGVRSGQLEAVLDGLMEHLRKVKALRSKFMGAMMYPAILMIIATCLVAVLLVFAVPSLKGIIATGSAPVPLITQVVFFASDVLRDHTASLLSGLAAGVLALALFVRSPAGRLTADRVGILLPYVGDLVLKYSLFNFSKTLASLLASGVSLVEALRVSLPAIENRFVRSRFEPVISEVENGVPLAEAVEKHQAAPPLMVKLLHVGYGAGDLEGMLNSASEIYAEEVEGALALLAGVLEPLLISGLGVVIGTIMLAVLLPMFSVIGNMQG